MFADSSNQICFSQFMISYKTSTFSNFSQFTNSFTFLKVNSYIIYIHFIFKPKYLISRALSLLSIFFPVPFLIFFLIFFHIFFMIFFLIFSQIFFPSFFVRFWFIYNVQR